MSMNQIDKELDRQETALEKQLNNGEISTREYNERCRDAEREARQEAQEQYPDDTYSKWQ
jgi:hypothetical protein